MRKQIVVLVVSLLVFAQIAVSQNVYITDKSGGKNNFPLLVSGNKTVILTDSDEAEVVRISCGLFAEDIERVTGTKPSVTNQLDPSAGTLVIAGTAGKNKWINQLEKNGKIDVQQIKGQWERYVIRTVTDPFPGIKFALVIVGSDRRGVAYGIFDISRSMGVSPWYWWADVPVRKRNALYLQATDYISKSPSVQFRGIFLNDEDWGLKPWAANKMDTDIKDIGPKTYARIFELLLRLKANYIWPAMHDCTKAFYFYPGNPETADKYAIVVGSSHCEPILRNNVFEWAVNYQSEYGKKPGEWRYDLNKSEIYKYWNDRAEQSKNFESVYTVGMRGIHDGSMPGPKSREEKVKLLEQVISDQREILSRSTGKNSSDIPQIFCPYKEVLQVYQSGLKLPDDITIVWADDNHGYVRQLSNPDEQKRKGASGVYYHLSYWGVPHDYLWLSSVSPSLVSYELSKAYALGASRLWVINVGDIKPAEEETQFAMDLAFDINLWNPSKASGYSEMWAAEIFGQQFSKQIAGIKSDYYRLAQSAKPEHLGVVTFDNATAAERLEDYKILMNRAELLKAEIPSGLQDAFFELVYYPVMGAGLMNQKILYADKSLRSAAEGDSSALVYSADSEKAFEKIKDLTDIYNNKISNGKWQGMISWNPRKLAVFNMPKVATADMIGKPVAVDNTPVVISGRTAPRTEGSSSREKVVGIGKTILSAADISAKKSGKGISVEIIDGLGIGGKGITVMPFTFEPFDEASVEKAPYIEFKTNLTAGEKSLTVKCLPSRSYYPGRKLRYAISVNKETPQVVNIDLPDENKTWAESVLRGFSKGKTSFNVSKSGIASVRLFILDPGLVVNRVEIE